MKIKRINLGEIIKGMVEAKGIFAFMRVIILLIFSLVVASCDRSLGDFVYVDNQNILHVDSKCKQISETKKAKPFFVISIDDLRPYNMSKLYCSSCVSEKTYKQIQQALEVNKERCLKVRRNWYNSLYGVCYFDDYNQFCKDIKNETFRWELYEAVKNKYFMADIDDFETFSQILLGFDYK